MKKLMVIISLMSVSIIISCGGNPRGNTTNPALDSLQVAPHANGTRPDNNVNNPRALTTDSAITGGAVLIADNDCKTCHTIDKKMTGPSYNMIADKYSNSAGMRDEMAYKIQHGGSGRWGTVLMPAHPQVSHAEATQMANYILSLKTK